MVLTVHANWSWQYVNSINCIVCVGVGAKGIWLRLEAPIMHGLSFLCIDKCRWGMCILVAGYGFDIC